MERKPLTRVQQNQIFELAAKFKLDPADFEWTEHEVTYSNTYICPRITHRPTAYYFQFGFGNNQRMLTWNPPFDGVGTFQFVDSWGIVTNFVVRWLETIKSDTDAPDLWAAAAGERALTDTATSPDKNQPFSHSEVLEIGRRLTELEAYIQTRHVLDEPGRVQLKVRVQYLRESAGRGLGRIDWLNIFIAQMVTMILAGIVPPSAYGDIMRHAATLLRTFFDALKALTP